MNKKAFIFYGGWSGHEPEKVSYRYQRILENEGYQVIREASMDRLADEAFLKSQDLIVPLWTQGQMEDQYAFHVADAVKSGVGIAGNHGGMCDSFRWNIEWQFMTGSQWVSHPGDVWYHHISDLSPENLSYVEKNYPSPSDAFETTYRVNIHRGVSSPIIEGLEDFNVTSEQYYLHLDPCVRVLASTLVTTQGPHSSNGPTIMPVAYTKLWGEGRVFYCSLGHIDRIFEIPQVAEMTRRGFLWATR